MENALPGTIGGNYEQCLQFAHNLFNDYHNKHKKKCAEINDFKGTFNCQCSWNIKMDRIKQVIANSIEVNVNSVLTVFCDFFNFCFFFFCMFLIFFIFFFYFEWCFDLFVFVCVFLCVQHRTYRVRI